jgi:hypothetical protein
LNLPEPIIDYLDEKVTGRIALIGCRAQDPENSFPCCEYDVACFDAPSQFDRIVLLDKNIIELHDFSSQRDAISLNNMIPISYQNMPLSSSDTAINELAPDRLLMGEGRKMIVTSLFNIETADKYMNSKIDLASMHLKIAAYNLIEGILLTLGVKPMPSHELNQVRNITQPKELFKNAIESALECLGLERASKTTINRSYKALTEILRNSDDHSIIASKIDYLLASGLLTDCYYYIGRIGISQLETSNVREVYPKLCKLTLDLNSDVGLTGRMSSSLKDACKKVLKVRV